MFKQKVRISIFIFIIFFTSFCIGLLIRQDMTFEAERVQSGVVSLYQTFAEYIVEDGLSSLFDAEARAANPDLAGHPPGYSMFLAFIFTLVDKSNFSIQIASVLFNSLSAVVIFLIALKLFPLKTSFLTGLLAAFCPQFGLNSVLLLPDTLAIFPILLAIYFLTISHFKPSWLTIILSAFCLGISCWLRANALLMPLFFAVSIWFLFGKEVRLKYAGAFLLVFILTISLITIRNAIVYKHFIPLSLGAGQTLLEGIADYDTEKRFGFPRTDVGIIQMEAKQFNRPEYGNSLFAIDGVQRDRWRINQGFQVIKDNPLWFFGVMCRRAFWMTRLERVRVVAKEIPVTRPVTEFNKDKVLLEILPSELNFSSEKLSPDSQIFFDQTGLLLQTDSSNYNPQTSLSTAKVVANNEYFAEVAVQLREGRISIKAQGKESKKIYSFVDFESFEWVSEQPVRTIQVPFVTDHNEPVELIIYNEPRSAKNSIVMVKSVGIYDLGISSNTWTRPFRFILGNLQRVYITAIMLPLAIIGFGILGRWRNWNPLLIISIVPVYYFCVQSVLHTEFRYVLALHYFFFLAVAVSLCEIGGLLISYTGRIKNKFWKLRSE